LRGSARSAIGVAILRVTEAGMLGSIRRSVVARSLIAVSAAALLACSVVVAAQHSRAGAQKVPGLIQVSFGQSEVWNPSRTAIAALHACGSVSFTCVQAAMIADGATDDSISFYRLTGWFLSAIDGSGGSVQLATVLNPWRANENEQPAILGGMPAVILPEREALVDNLAAAVQRDPAWAALQQTHPNALLWQSSPSVEAVTPLDTGGERILFDYRLLDGCHACAILGVARVAYDFDADGSFEGAHFLGIAASGQP
jgi:hypothetical protein